MAGDYSRRNPEVSFTDLEGGLIKLQLRCTTGKMYTNAKHTASVSMNGNLFASDKHFPPLNTSLALNTRQPLHRVTQSHKVHSPHKFFLMYTLYYFHTYRVLTF